MNIFTILFYEPIYNVLIVIYRLLGENLGLAIIAIALLARLILFPFTMRQIKMAESSKEFSAKANEVKKKYKNNKEKQNQELMKLQSEYLPKQLAGCLPLIFQFIFFINMYNVIRNIINEGAIGFNKVSYSFVPVFEEGYKIHTSFFGIMNLDQSANQFSFTDPKIIPYLLVVILVGASQYLSTKVLMGMRKKKEDGKEKGKGKGKKKGKAGKDAQPEDFSQIMEQSTQQAMLLLPLMIAFISYSLPSGLGIYWTAQSTFVIIQQFITYKLSNRRSFDSAYPKGHKQDDKNQ